MARISDAHEPNSDLTNVSSPGLTSEEASRRLEAIGPNEPASRHRTGNLGQLARLFANPLVLILIAASVISGLVGDLINAGLVLGIVIL